MLSQETEYFKKHLKRNIMSRFKLDDVLAYVLKDGSIVCAECYDEKEHEAIGVVLEKDLEKEVLFCDVCKNKI
jgi:uncharacterized CHY-type Zn-finger protein